MSAFTPWPEPHPVPRGALQYGERGICHVWEHVDTGRKRWDFADEDLAMQCAVRLGSVVEANIAGQPRDEPTPDKQKTATQSR